MSINFANYDEQKNKLYYDEQLYENNFDEIFVEFVKMKTICKNCHEIFKLNSRLYKHFIEKQCIKKSFKKKIYFISNCNKTAFVQVFKKISRLSKKDLKNSNLFHDDIIANIRNRAYHSRSERIRQSFCLFLEPQKRRTNANLYNKKNKFCEKIQSECIDRKRFFKIRKICNRRKQQKSHDYKLQNHHKCFH